MAIARVEPVTLRRYDPSVLRAPSRPRWRPSGRLVLLAIVVGGAWLQHVMTSVPLEARPAPIVAAPIAPPRTQMRPQPRVQPIMPQHVVAHPAAPPVSRPALKPVAHVAAFHRAASAPARPAPAAGTPRQSALLPPPGPQGDLRRVALAPNPDGAIMHVPSVSVAAVRAALQEAGSPVLDASYADHKDAAEYIWDSGRVLGVDPAVVMGIFRHESHYGTLGMARLTASVGNIRPLPGQPHLGGYRLYRSWQEGIDDCYRLLRSYARNGATTVAQAIPVWAPPSDGNDDSAYIASVLDTMNTLYATSTR